MDRDHVQTPGPLQLLSDDQLLRRLTELLASSRRVEAELVAHIGEVDARRLYARAATPSMFAYCTDRLGLSEAEAYLRIAAARASRVHPELLAMLADGRLHLSGIAKLAPHLTPENRQALLSRAAHKSKRQIDELIAEMFPRADVPPSIRKLPVRRVGHGVALAAAERAGLAAAPEANGCSAASPVDLLEPAGPELKPVTATRSAAQTAASSRELRPDEVGLAPTIAPEGAPGPAGVAVVAVGSGARRAVTFEPLAPARYRVQFTASAGLREKLERLQALLRGSVPDGDLAAIIEDAVTEKLQRLETRRFGRTAKPKGNKLPVAEAGKARGWLGEAQGKAADYGTRGGMTPCDLPASSRHVSAAVRRAVSERDGDRCRYVDAEGRRCTARHRLEFHHRFPFGYGGGHSVSNVSLVCRAHNRYLAAVDYGKGMGSGTAGATPTSGDGRTGGGSRSGSDSGRGGG